MSNFAVYKEISNRILLSLPLPSLERLLPDLELLNTTTGERISRIEVPIKFLYFVNRGIISLVKTMRDGRVVEIGAVGVEGITDPYALFGLYSAPVEAIVQIPGTALRIDREVLKHRMAEDAALRTVLEKYSNFALLALAQTAAYNRLHVLEERCCRWLLIAHDSALSDTFPLTHEFLAMMLGVRRPGVSIAANILKKAGLIRYSRGQVTITDRGRLEDAACECYAEMCTEFEKLFGSRQLKNT